MLQTVIQYTFFYIGCAHASGVKVSIVVATNVFVGIIISSLLYRQEKLSGRKLIGCLIGFAGVVLVNLSSAGGLLLRSRAPGDVVKPGQILADVLDPCCGQILEHLRSDCTGRVFFARRSRLIDGHEVAFRILPDSQCSISLSGEQAQAK